VRTAGCDRGWMAEAIEDGRLAEADRTAFRRHMGGCSDCLRAANALGRLHDRMAALPYAETTDLHHQAQRRRLMARAETSWGRSPQPGGRRWGRHLLAAALLTGAAAVVLVARTHPRVETPTAEAPLYEVTGLADGSWTNAEAGPVARVALTRGSAAFHVHHLRAGQRFLVTLPDGEIEVRGTRFVVEIAGGRTRYVVVMEGKVALRRPGAEERLLIAGERWDAPPSPPPSPPEHIESPGPAAVAPLPPRRMQPRGERAIVAASGTHPSSAEPPRRVIGDGAAAGEPSLSRAASNLFARGIEAFRAGRYQQAELFWGWFLDRHGADPRAEDAAFLRAVGRARMGDAAGAGALAREYLERFPRGMRRREAEALSRQGH